MMNEQEQDDVLICAKEVSDMLGCSDRHAARLMAGGEISSMRIGKPWRTTRKNVKQYVQDSFERHRRGLPELRCLENAIVCLREVERLGTISAEQKQELCRFESRLEMALLPPKEAVVSIIAEDQPVLISSIIRQVA